MTHMIILEGPDSSGKTTLAQSFERKGYKYHHMGPPRHDCLRESYIAYATHLNNTVFDRSHLGEQVYGPLFRLEDSLGPIGQQLLDAYCETRRAVVILCLPPFTVARDIWQGRTQEGKEMFNHSFEAQYERFVQLHTHLPKLKYDWTKETHASLMNRYAMARRNFYR